MSIEQDLTHLFENERKYLLSVIWHTMGANSKRDQVEDILQIGCLKAWAHRASFEGRCPLRNWVAIIMHREVLAFHRTRKIDRNIQVLVAEHFEIPDGTDAEKNAIDNLLIREVVRKAKSFSAVYRIEILHALCGGTGAIVKTNKFRVIRKLREAMK